MMSDSDDADLENLRQLALTSLLKKKAVPQQTKAVFYRPVSNSNLISIQPVNGIDQSDNEGEQDDTKSENGRSEDESSSGSEYAVVEEGLSVSSGDVDQVIEEVIVSDEEENISGQDEEEDAEDAISLASHDSFDEILNSVEEEIRGAKIKKRPSTDGNIATGATESKRLRPDPEPLHRNTNSLHSRQNRSRSPLIRDSYHREHDTLSRPGPGIRRPSSPPSPPYYRDRRSNSPRTQRRNRSPLRGRRPSPENKQFKLNLRQRKSPSPILLRKGEGRANANGRDTYSRSRSRPNDLRHSNSRNGYSRSQNQFSEADRRRSLERRRSRSPRNKLSFGDHRLRDMGKHSSRQTSRERDRFSRSPGPKRREREKSKSPQLRRTRTPSPAIDLSSLTPEERTRIEKRKLKFKSEPSQSGKVNLKSTRQEPKRSSKVQITFESSEKKSSSSISSRLGTIVKKGDRNEDRSRRRPPESSKTISLKVKDQGQDTTPIISKEEDVSNNNSPKRPLSTGSRSPGTKSSSIGEDDLRTKLQQKRAANVRIFTVALKDTLHKDASMSPLS